MLHVVILASFNNPSRCRQGYPDWGALSRHNQHEEAFKYLNMDIEILRVETPPSMGKERPSLSRRNKQVFHGMI